MAIQNVNLGVAPTGAGGDTFRSAAAKINDNFANNAHAASRLVGVSDGNVMEVGAFGLGTTFGISVSGQDLNNGILFRAGLYSGDSLSNSPYPAASGIYSYLTVNNLASGGASLYQHQEITAANHSVSNQRYYRVLINGGWSAWHKYLTSGNTVVDANGFLKAASPIIQLFADRIELNNEAKEQDITFEKVDVGNYLISSSSGFAQDGWYIETPKDANGNVLFSVIYETLKNSDISVKTYKKKFDLETASIVADLDSPVDITEGRWIDVRLQELPQPEIEMPESSIPLDFQPTGLAQAVAAVMESYHDPE